MEIKIVINVVNAKTRCLIKQYELPGAYTTQDAAVKKIKKLGFKNVWTEYGPKMGRKASDGNDEYAGLKK